MSTDIPNRIKQPAKCCVHCGKSYKKKTNLDKHIIVCELLHNSKNKTTIDELKVAAAVAAPGALAEASAAATAAIAMAEGETELAPPVCICLF